MEQPQGTQAEMAEFFDFAQASAPTKRPAICPAHGDDKVDGYVQNLVSSNALLASIYRIPESPRVSEQRLGYLFPVFFNCYV
jgi:hypothetical protein